MENALNDLFWINPNSSKTKYVSRKYIHIDAKLDARTDQKFRKI